jgi:hypothetical protein
VGGEGTFPSGKEKFFHWPGAKRWCKAARVDPQFLCSVPAMKKWPEKGCAMGEDVSGVGLMSPGANARYPQ